MRSHVVFAENPTRRKQIFEFLLKSFTVSLLFGINFAVYAQNPEREKPRLIDFGASLRPDYVKPKAEAENPIAKVKNPAAVGDDEVISVETNLVGSDVLVLDEKGFAVINLSKDDFLITEDGAPQQIEFFQLGKQSNVPRSIVLIIDYSGSLKPYIKNSVAAAKTLIDKLNPLDKVAIVTDDVKLITDFTRDKKTLKKNLDALEDKALKGIPGRSLQYSALYAALNELFDVEDVRPIVIFQTDGDEYPFLSGNFGVLPPQISRSLDYSNRTTNFTFRDVVTATEKARATVYTIIPGLRFLGISPEEAIAQGRLYSLKTQAMDARLNAFKNSPTILEARAKSSAPLYARYFQITHQSIVSTALTSGGWAEYLETPEKADVVYSNILADINNRYVLGFYPTNQTRDGKRRTVKVEIRNHPEYKIFTRRSYYAPEN